MNKKERADCTDLPKGWQREEVVRKSGLSAGKVDVYYYSPTGKKIRSKPELVRYLGESVDLSAFNFHGGENSTVQLNQPKKPRTQFNYSALRSDARLVLPIRQTASIFKQPVTIYKNRESIVNHDLKYGNQEPPKQLYWEKRLEVFSNANAI